MSGTVTAAAAEAARAAAPTELAALLRDARQRTLRNFAAFEAALPGLAVPLRDELNPPLWEAGHVAWFQEWWIGRNPLRHLGCRAMPDASRPPSCLPGADARYDSSAVAHDTRWTQPAIGAERIRSYLDETLEDTLRLLAAAEATDAELYFYRLALFHEDMHNEAAAYMANGLGLDVGTVGPPAAEGPAGEPLRIEPARHRLGWDRPGFAFDNELGCHARDLPGYTIDSAPVSNAAYAAFVDGGGYAEPRHWSEAGWRWRTGARLEHPRFWRRRGDGWEQRWFGRWRALEPAAPACNLALHEAEAWCRWAGRRLPDEAEWEYAAISEGESFRWGQVWEWTASPFHPYPGFVAHPYRDYSAPWFGSRRVLRGGAVITAPRMKHPKYRNYFPPERNDIVAGFRSCAL